MSRYSTRLDGPLESQSIGGQGIHPGDIAIIVLYFVGTIAVGIWTIVKAKTNIKDFFLAGRSMTWWPVGMSLFASNIGSVNFVGIAGSGAASGLSVIMFEWNAIFLLVLLGWVFLPVYIASGIYTMPEYLQWRFGGVRLRIYLSVVALITYMISTCASDLYSGAIFIQQSLGWNIWASAVFLLAIALIFTALGGLETVILTDALAVVIMVIGGIVLCILGFVRIGGYPNLKYKYMRAIPNNTLENIGNTTCGVPRADAFNIFRDIWFSDYPWLGTMLRSTFGSLWYWCANQVLVQRAMAAKTITHAKGGCILAGYLKLLPMFIMVFPGMISRALWPDEIACADPVTCERVCQNPAGCSNIALPKLVMELLPAGVRGLLISAMIAAVISSLTSIFNSCTALFTMDLWSRGRPKASQRELLFVGRLFVVVLVAVAIALIPVMQQAKGGEIFQYATSVQGLLGAPTCAMFLLAMFWKRCNEQGAFWGMLISQIWGLVKFIVDFVYPKPGCGFEDNRPAFVKDWHVYYHTFSQILLAFLIAIVISLATEKVPNEKIVGLTFWTRFDKPYRDQVAEKEKKERLEREEFEEKERLESEKAVVVTDNGSGITKSNGLRKLSKVHPLPGPEDTSPVTTKDEKVSEKEGDSEKAPTLKERFVESLCGSKEQNEEDGQGPLDIFEDHATRVASIQQTPFWRTFMNVNAIILLFVTIFLYGFFH